MFDHAPTADDRQRFEDFVREHWSSLMTIGVAVAGSRAEAEDLVQTALTNAYGRWHRVRTEDAIAYLRRSIVNARISRWRRHHGELILADVPEQVTIDQGPGGVEHRQVLLPMLRTLPIRQRAVLVLRYLCDLPDDEIAHTLGITATTVRSQAFRGLAALRRSAHESLDRKEVHR